jgi:hypothetical protein
MSPRARVLPFAPPLARISADCFAAHPWCTHAASQCADHKTNCVIWTREKREQNFWPMPKVGRWRARKREYASWFAFDASLHCAKLLQLAI